MFLKDQAAKPVVAASSAGDAPKRGELRTPATRKVRVLGIDANGKPFYSWAETQDISLSGARITGLSAKLSLGEIVGVQCGGIKARFKVAWVQQNADGTCQAGLHCMERGATPWRDDAQPDNEQDRQSAKIYSCHGTASLQSLSDPNSIRGTVRDLSLTGCYLRTDDMVSEGEILRGRFFFTGMQFDAVAQVRNSIAGSGMVLQWTDLGSNGQEKLKYLLKTLATSSSEDELCIEQARSRICGLREALTQIYERLESGNLPANTAVMKELDDAYGSLTAALKLAQL